MLKLAHIQCSITLLMMAAALSSASGSLFARESTVGLPQQAWGRAGGGPPWLGGLLKMASKEKVRLVPSSVAGPCRKAQLPF